MKQLLLYTITPTLGLLRNYIKYKQTRFIKSILQYFPSQQGLY